MINFFSKVFTKLEQTKYHEAVSALGGVGFIIENEDEIESILSKAREFANVLFLLPHNKKLKKPKNGCPRGFGRPIAS